MSIKRLEALPMRAHTARIISYKIPMNTGEKASAKSSAVAYMCFCLSKQRLCVEICILAPEIRRRFSSRKIAATAVNTRANIYRRLSLMRHRLNHKTTKLAQFRHRRRSFFKLIVAGAFIACRLFAAKHITAPRPSLDLGKLLR
jgi:hypothetical protein